MEPSSCYRGSNTSPSHVRWNRKHRRRPPWQFGPHEFHLSRTPLPHRFRLELISTYIFAKRRSGASLWSFNGASVNESLTFRDASLGSQPVISTDTFALR